MKAVVAALIQALIVSVEPEVLVDLVTRDQDGGPGAGARYALAWTRDTL